ncbi:hypothetical protein AVEN_138417-1 [Araneus ventricosus]|uniref:Uncharacterized protein n=1 Tax=Araneus ventricosus TaxID=182803 RepID=A0A4Y2P8U4_ARAVE|nr:hypothetical protein AVEN_138417-1 [Araneus ventricosus]
MYQGQLQQWSCVMFSDESRFGSLILAGLSYGERRSRYHQENNLLNREGYLGNGPHLEQRSVDQDDNLELAPPSPKLLRHTNVGGRLATRYGFSALNEWWIFRTGLNLRDPSVPRVAQRPKPPRGHRGLQ